MKDKLVTCLHCGGNCCYETEFKRFKSWMCIGCGFQTNSNLNESQYIISYEETLPELHKDLRYSDLNNRYWYPATINFPQKGIIFANGTDKDNWKWTAMLATEVQEEEKEKFKKPDVENEYFTHKMDAKTAKHFERNKGFMEAMDYIGMFQNQE